MKKDTINLNSVEGKELFHITNLNILTYAALSHFEDLNFATNRKYNKQEVRRALNLARAQVDIAVGHLNSRMTYKTADFQNKTVQDIMDIYGCLIMCNDSKRDQIKEYAIAVMKGGEDAIV